MTNDKHDTQASEASEAQQAAEAAGEYVTVKPLAAACGVGGKQFRTFLRSHVKQAGGTVGIDTPGRGKQYAFRSSQFDAICAAFKAWQHGGGGYMLVSLFDDEAADEEAADA